MPGQVKPVKQAISAYLQVPPKSIAGSPAHWLIGSDNLRGERFVMACSWVQNSGVLRTLKVHSDTPEKEVHGEAWRPTESSVQVLFSRNGYCYLVLRNISLCPPTQVRTATDTLAAKIPM